MTKKFTLSLLKSVLGCSVSQYSLEIFLFIKGLLFALTFFDFFGAHLLSALTQMLK